jgi:hypothetical protein
MSKMTTSNCPPSPPAKAAAALSPADPAVPDAAAGRGIHARQALARAQRQRGGPSPGHQPSAPGGQDRHGLPRLRPAHLGDHLGGQCRAHAGGQEVRARQGIPPRHLRHVVDQGGHPRVHPALLVAGQDGHDGEPEEAVLQSAQGEGPDPGHRGGRSAPRSGQARSPPGSACRKSTSSR